MTQPNFSFRASQDDNLNLIINNFDDSERQSKQDKKVDCPKNKIINK